MDSPEFLKIEMERVKSDYENLAIAHIKLRDYKKAKNYLNALLKIDARNSNALALKSLLFDLISSDGLIGALLVALTACGLYLSFKSFKFF
ncbi:tetratricopeptide repeat protein 11 [Plasmodium vivax North Korean]|uniref:Tetratricopeptide repeat protein 11 n=1 Tax=Plasmodium vivax North Korean TaxID=1035514 RepID=A0A0J9TQV6_PLAVI|nr:tetratricopeptide repeat protein 11 [Plasmodium vivax North Korean]